jgi:hypothetical protein
VLPVNRKVAPPENFFTAGSVPSGEVTYTGVVPIGECSCIADIVPIGRRVSDKLKHHLIVLRFRKTNLF